MRIIDHALFKETSASLLSKSDLESTHLWKRIKTKCNIVLHLALAVSLEAIHYLNLTVNASFLLFEEKSTNFLLCWCHNYNCSYVA